MRRRSSTNANRRRSTLRRRSEKVCFDEFGFAHAKRKDQKLHDRCHDYSYPQMNSVRVKELSELLSYWNGASFICKNQIERFIRMGIPPNMRSRVWKCLLSTDSLRDSSNFNYQKCLSDVRGPLVDLGVSEYGIMSAIATLNDTQNDLGLSYQQHSSPPEPCSVEDITLFRQIALDLQRSFPTHRSLMGDSPEAIEGQAKLFRILTAYAKYNPQVGYSQGMSYIAAVLLMQLEEEEAFWALTALLDKPKYLAELFDLSLTKVQHQVKVFDQFLKHRKPQLYQHLESVGVLSVHFVMPWFLTMFTSLPCWDTVLAVWDLIILQGLSAMFRTALTIIELMEPVLLNLKDEGALLTLLLRVPVDATRYTVLVPALWNMEAQDWELKCMNNLVLDESHHEPKSEQKLTVYNKIEEGKGKENISPTLEDENTTKKDSDAGGKSVLSRWMLLAQKYLLNPMSRQRVEKRNLQMQASKSKQYSSAPGQGFRSQTSASLTHSQILSRRQSQQIGGVHKPLNKGGGEVIVAPESVKDSAGCGETDRSDFTFKRTSTGPVVKVARHRSNHSIVQPIRPRSFRLLRKKKNGINRPPSPNATKGRQQQQQHDTPRTALIKELSSRHQTGRQAGMPENRP